MQYQEHNLKCSPLKQIRRDIKRLDWQYEVGSIPRKRLPAIVGWAVWAKVTK